jgi:hypothetical protein
MPETVVNYESCYTGQRVSDFMRFSRKLNKSWNVKKANWVYSNREKLWQYLFTVSIGDTSKKNGRFPIQFQTKIIMEFIKVVCEIASTQNNTWVNKRDCS